MEEIKSDYLQLLSDRHYAIGYTKRLCRVSTQLAIQDQRHQPSSDSSDESNEECVPHDYDGQPLTQACAVYLDCIVRSAHHFSLRLHTNDLMMRRCGLAQDSYHPL